MFSGIMNAVSNAAANAIDWVEHQVDRASMAVNRAVRDGREVMEEATDATERWTLGQFLGEDTVTEIYQSRIEGPLAALPDEILFRIFRYIPNPHNFILVSKTCHAVSQTHFTREEVAELPLYMQKVVVEANFANVRRSCIAKIVRDALGERACALVRERFVPQNIEDGIYQRTVGWVGVDRCRVQSVTSYYLGMRLLEDDAHVQDHFYCLESAQISMAFPAFRINKPEDVQTNAALYRRLRQPIAEAHLALFSKTIRYLIMRVQTHKTMYYDVAVNVKSWLGSELEYIKHTSFTFNQWQLESLVESLAKIDQFIEDYNLCQFCSRLPHIEHRNLPESPTYTQVTETAAFYRAALSAYPYSQVTELDLSGLGLTRMPELLGMFYNVRKLDLSDNHFYDFPETICNLEKLQHLDLDNNNITKLPDSFLNLKHLETLYIKARSYRFSPDKFAHIQRELPNLSISTK